MRQRVVGQGVFTLENKKWQCYMDSTEKTGLKKIINK